MTAFNRAIWHSWILEGYTFIRYRHLDEDTVLLKPVKEDHGEHGVHEGFTCLPITAEEISEMADNEIMLLENFKFYVEE